MTPLSLSQLVGTRALLQLDQQALGDRANAVEETENERQSKLLGRWLEGRVCV